MTIAIELNWSRCPDGYELFDYGPMPDVDMAKYVMENRYDSLAELGVPRLFKPKSDARQRGKFGGPRGLHVRPISRKVITEEFTLESAGEGPALAFINADTDKKVMGFLAKWGVPLGRNGGVSELPFQKFADQREILSGMLSWPGSTPASRGRAFNILSERDEWGRPRLALQLMPREPRPKLLLMAGSLYDFMRVEIAILLSGEARVVTCDHCSKLFTTGLGSGKRSNALYCSNSCRSGASRARRLSR